jgi:hypothetical protein
MKSELNSDITQEAVASDDLLALLRGGKLEYNQEDVENVLKAYVQCKMFDDVLKCVGLDGLPDPDDEHARELSDLEDWMVGAFQEIDKIRGIEIRTDAKCREDLAAIVTQFGEG